MSLVKAYNQEGDGISPDTTSTNTTSASCPNGSANDNDYELFCSDNSIEYNNVEGGGNSPPVLTLTASNSNSACSNCTTDGLYQCTTDNGMWICCGVNTGICDD